MAAEEVRGAVHDLRDGGGPAFGRVPEGGGEVRARCGVDALHQDVEFSAAGQADGEGVFVGVAEPGSLRVWLVVEYLLAQLVYGAFDASAGDAADGVTVCVDRDRGADGQGCAAGDADDGGQGEGAVLVAPVTQCVRDVQHGFSPQGTR